MLKKSLAVGIVFLFIFSTVTPMVIGFDVETTDERFIDVLSFDNLLFSPHEPIYILGDEDFTIINGVVSGSGTIDKPYIIEGWNINSTFQDGIVIRNVSVYFIIKDCYIHDGGIYNDGVAFYNVTNGVIYNNTIARNRNGVMYRSQYPGKENSENNIISRNSIISNINDGINFEHTGYGYHKNNTISHNNISGNTRGIFLIMSADNQIIFNNIISNQEQGVILDMCMGGGEHNIIHHNNFVYNGEENKQAQERGGPINYWFDSYPSGGNFWSDYLGEDEFQGSEQNIPGSDGLGDIPYNIPDGINQDTYPLMEPYGNINIAPKIPTLSGPKIGTVDQEYNYSFYTTDPDGDEIYYHVQWGDTIFPIIYGPYSSGVEVILNHSWSERGTYIINVMAEDIYGAESDWATLKVTMPKNKPFFLFNAFIEWLFERFPLLEYLFSFLQ